MKVTQLQPVPNKWAQFLSKVNDDKLVLLRKVPHEINVKKFLGWNNVCFKEISEIKGKIWERYWPLRKKADSAAEWRLWTWWKDLEKFSKNLFSKHPREPSVYVMASLGEAISHFSVPVRKVVIKSTEDSVSLSATRMYAIPTCVSWGDTNRLLRHQCFGWAFLAAYDLCTAA